MQLIKKIKVGDTTIRIEKNRNNAIGGFWNPLGKFQNSTLIKKDGQWYHCGISFIKRGDEYYLCVSDLIKHRGKTNIIEEHISGVYTELRISKFKMNLLLILQNAHGWNKKSYDLRKFIFKRRARTLLFVTTIALALGFYFGNKYDASLGEYFVKNPWIQILSITLNIISFGSLFLPFTFRKELSEDDFKQLFLEQMKKYEEEKRNNENARKRATV